MSPCDQTSEQLHQQDAQAADTGDHSQLDHEQATGHVPQVAQTALPPDAAARDGPDVQ